MKRQLYTKPPLIEAVCEFRFTQPENKSWDAVIPGLVYERLGGESGEFPLRESVKSDVELNLTVTTSGIVPQMLESRDRAQFLNQERNLLIQVAPFLFATNHLVPYSSWPNYRAKIQKGYETYLKVANPVGLDRIGMRYINRVKMPVEKVELEDYFEFRPFRGEASQKALGENYVGFVVGVQIPFEQERDILKLQLANAQSNDDDKLPIAILDLDYIMAKPGQISLDNVVEWLEVAHNRIEDAFETSITPKLRKFFSESS